MYSIIVDGIAWIDPDGRASWDHRDTSALVVHIYSLGYDDIQVVPA